MKKLGYCLPFFFVMTSLGVTACHDPLTVARLGQQGDECEFTKDCAPPLICVEGFCTEDRQAVGGLGENCYLDGTCDPGLECVDGICECVPQCAGLECGLDPLCGQPCGTCGENQECVEYSCVCVPDCYGLECGDDRCGGSCGGCGVMEICHQGHCVDSDIKQGGLGASCFLDDTCDPGLECVAGICECVPDCQDFECGDDGCGGSCGSCGVGEMCVLGYCEDYIECYQMDCGWDPLTGVSCGTCPLGEICEANHCNLETVYVLAGDFWMGCDELVDDRCRSNELPYHEVSVPGFWISRYPITVEQFSGCVHFGPCSPPKLGSYCNFDVGTKMEHPINCVDWSQAREYCAWIGGRLCSEAEWEKAARGLDERLFPWGNDPATCIYAVFNESGGQAGFGCGEGGTAPVDSRFAGESPYGVVDMSGSVWEWVEDDWHWNYDGSPADGSAWVNNPRGTFRVLRGGSFGSPAEFLRASYRKLASPALKASDHGIRCCM